MAGKLTSHLVGIFESAVVTRFKLTVRSVKLAVFMNEPAAYAKCDEYIDVLPNEKFTNKLHVN